MARPPPAICTSCFAELPAAACACGLSRAEVVWTPFPCGVGRWCLRIAIGLLMTAIAAVPLAGAMLLWFGAPEPSWPMAVRLMCGAVSLGVGVLNVGVANAVWFGRRWDYRSADGLTSGWVVRMFGGIFEGSGEHGVSVTLPAPPASEVDSGVLGLPSCDTATGLVLTVLGLAARGRVVLRRVERRSVKRPPNWALSLGWWRARTSPHPGGIASRVEIAATTQADDRWLERALLAVLPVPRDPGAGAAAEPYRTAAGRGEHGDFVPFSEAFIDWMLAVHGPTVARSGAKSDSAPTRVVGMAEAERALAACRAMAPSIVEEIERTASDSLECFGDR